MSQYLNLSTAIEKLRRGTCCLLLCLPGLTAHATGKLDHVNDPLTLGTNALDEVASANDPLDFNANAQEPDTTEASLADELRVSEGANRARLVSQTKLLGGLCVVTAVGLYSMPHRITGWDHDAKLSNLPREWWSNVSREPIWDSDNFFFNYIGHPYVGGVYYQMARKSGYTQGGSLLYSALMSTFLWEYGVEAFAERPSIQDLFVTPLAGWAVGEWAFRTEKKIVANQGRVLGSEILGDVSLFMMDPMSHIGNGINRLVGGEWILTGAIVPQSASARYASKSNNSDDFGFHSPTLMLSLQLQF